MYVWFGINVDNQLSDFKEKVFKICNKYNSITQFQYHPAHISTKISFEIDDSIFEDIVNDALGYYSSLAPFEIESKAIETENNFLWLRWKDNSKLTEIHNSLCELVAQKYNIKLHEFDFDYKYHTTLFTDADKLNKNLYNEIFKLIFPNKITVNEFFVGSSKDNLSENYKIYKSIKLRGC